MLSDRPATSSINGIGPGRSDLPRMLAIRSPIPTKIAKMLAIRSAMMVDFVSPAKTYPPVTFAPELNFRLAPLRQPTIFAQTKAP